MARGGRVIYTKANSNRGRKRKACSKEDIDDDEDEEYVVGEDEVEESESDYESDVNSRDLSDEESFEFSESDDDEDEENFKITRSKKKQEVPSKSRVSDEEMDDLNPWMRKKGGARRPKKQKFRDSDYELDDEDDDDEDFSPDEEDFDEDEVSMVSMVLKRKGVKNLAQKRRSKVPKTKGRKKGRTVASPARKRQKRTIGNSDDDFIVKDRVSIGRNKTKNVRTKRSGVNSESLDSDFVVSDDDFVEKDLLVINKKSKKVKKMTGSKGTRKKRSAEDAESSDSDFVISDDDDGDDDDYDVKDRVMMDKQQENSKKVKKTTGRKKRSVEESELSDSDFVISDDDFDVKDQIVVDKQQKNSEKEKALGFNKGRRRRKRSTVVLESSGSDCLISEDDDEFILKDQVLVDKQQEKNEKGNAMCSNKWGRRRRRGSSVVLESSDSDYLISEDDDEFILKDQVVVDKVDRHQENRKKEKAVCSKKGERRKRKRSSVVLESSDSDYLISEDDDDFLLKDQVMIDKQQKKSKKVRKKGTEPKRTRRRLSSLVGSESESFDFDDVISEEEVRDLGIIEGLHLEQPKRLVAGKKREEKGKDKEADDLGKQVCGICLSEEKKSVIQGLLNCCFHYFCFACIMEWSKVESRCPVCKRRFETITKSGRSDPGFGMRSAVIRVQKRDQVYQPSEEELRGMSDPYENVVCMECQQGGDDNLMLLCDICDSSAHTYCVGLGREVPEGNWYCECCRSVSDGPLHSQFQGTIPDQESNNNNLFPGVTERGGFSNRLVSANSPRPVSVSGRSSSLRIDLNFSPRDFPGEDHFVSSPISGSGASTVSGRRHIRQRIHVILSTNRQRQTSAGTNMLRPNSAADVAQNGEALTASENRRPFPSTSSFEQRQQNPRPFFRSHNNLTQCMFNEGSSLRHVDGAKEEVQNRVKSHLKSLSQNRLLEHSTFREIARISTHTILAACGIEHRKSMVSASVEPPDNCTHDLDDGPVHLLKGCCSSCFSSFVKDVVQRLINSTS